ncbi:hypothetical protein N9D31_03575 [Oligoflexaceae bacterium]|nr:hypothetical protein [Oligoflexaceae bacterium]
MHRTITAMTACIGFLCTSAMADVHDHNIKSFQLEVYEWQNAVVSNWHEESDAARLFVRALSQLSQDPQSSTSVASVVEYDQKISALKTRLESDLDKQRTYLKWTADLEDETLRSQQKLIGEILENWRLTLAAWDQKRSDLRQSYPTLFNDADTLRNTLARNGAKK